MLILYRAGGHFAANGLQKALQPSQDVAPHDWRVGGAHLRAGGSIEHPPREFERPPRLVFLEPAP
jgi:hypothetical protein